MSQVDVSGVVFLYDEKGHRYVSNPYDIPVNMTTTKKNGTKLEDALRRAKQQIEAQNRRPKYAMQSSHWYMDKNGVTCVNELRSALNNSFKCKLDMQDLKLIAKNFPNEYGGIDFKMLTARLFANQGDRRKYINLRQQALKPSQFPGLQASPTAAATATATATVGGYAQTQQSLDITAPMAVGQPQSF
jgi:hypothetical protein